MVVPMVVRRKGGVVLLEVGEKWLWLVGVVVSLVLSFYSVSMLVHACRVDE